MTPPLHFILLYFPYFGRILNIFGVGGRRGYCKFTVTRLLEGGSEVSEILMYGKHIGQKEDENDTKNARKIQAALRMI